MKKLFFLAGLLAAICPTLQADVVRYALTGETGSQVSTSAAFVDSLATATNLTRGPGVTATAGANSINSSDWTTGALDANDYYEFTITSLANTSMTLTNLSFRERRSNTGIGNFEVRTSTDGFATYTSQFSFVVPDDAGNRDQSFSLSGLSNLAGGTTVAFRFYGFNSEAAGGTWRLADFAADPAQGVNVDGAIIAVPEPSLGLVGLGGLCALGMLRRRKVLQA